MDKRQDLERRDSTDGSTSQDTLMGHDRGDVRYLGRQTLWTRTCGLMSPWRWALDTILLVIILIVVLQKNTPDSSSSCSRMSKMQLTGDITGVAPDFPEQIVKFEPDGMFVPENTSLFFTPEVQQKWLDLVPKGLGYQIVEHPEQYDNLPTPLPQRLPKNVFTTSMTHQLHCLYAMAEVFSAFSADPQKVPVDYPWHMGHCFDYLRQSIMCAGDMALEGTQTTFPDGVEGTDGWDAKHVCKDYSKVYEYLEDHRADDEEWI